jgi:hypothetical protein
VLEGLNQSAQPFSCPAVTCTCCTTDLLRNAVSTVGVGDVPCVRVAGSCEQEAMIFEKLVVVLEIRVYCIDGVVIDST